MSEDLNVAQAAPEAASGLSQIERVVDTFAAPTKTFTDIKRSASWWLPYLIALAIGIAFTFTAIQKIGYEKLADGVIAQSSSLQDQVSSSTPEVAAQIHASIEKQFKYTLYALPVLIIVIALICAGVLLATVNFGLGGEATFRQMLAVWFYGTLPVALISVLAIVAIFAGLGGDEFNMQNPVGTNLGFYLSSDLPKWLKALLDSVDVFTIWSACLLTIGVSIAGKIKRSSAAACVFGWWILYILVFKIAVAALRG